MKKNKILIIAGAFVCVVLAVIALTMGLKKDEESNLSSDESNLSSDEGGTDSSTGEVVSNRWKNLILHQYKSSSEDIKEVYNLKLLSDNSHLERTNKENIEIIDKVINEFFMEEVDKSYAELILTTEEDSTRVPYDEKNLYCDDKIDSTTISLFGRDTENGGYMMQVDEVMINNWFSRYGLGDIGPFLDKSKRMYTYVSCERPSDDIEVKLKDGKIKLSELEDRVLSYLNDASFLKKPANVTYGVGQVGILENGEYEAACFKIRRIYKGVPFEYGSSAAVGSYIDMYGHERGEITYVESTRPDTLLCFGQTNETVVEMETITEMISKDEALDILSKKIGENSVYDVYGVELVYRECVRREEREEGVARILKPVWKIITVNQNDDKYTLFYVDVVTGEVTERFEYYYE